jgi:hypothetical protein
MTDGNLYDEASKVTANNGEVALDGPDGVDVQVTPEAAERTADNLIEGAVKARGQRRLKNYPTSRSSSRAHAFAAQVLRRAGRRLCTVVV